jgi:mono/diheme cytochrome c family protein
MSVRADQGPCRWAALWLPPQCRPGWFGELSRLRRRQRRFEVGFPTVLAGSFLLLAALARADNTPSAYPPQVQKILSTYCYDCHGDGMEKGKVAFDQFTSSEMLTHRDVFLAALKNVRAGIMPPEKKPRPDAEEQRALADWIKADILQIDPQNPDPGKVTVRRLNRTEYHNTIRDLTGFDFKVDDELPPDDTGYGFDTIGDVLNLSPLLLEKYMRAAETITREAVPRVSRVAPEETLAGSEFKGIGDAAKLNFYEMAAISNLFKASAAGKYKLKLNLEVHGQFEFDPGKCRAVLKADSKDVWTNEFGWQNGKKFSFEVDQQWQPGPHALTLEVQPLSEPEKKQNSLELRLKELVVRGPLDERHGTRPKNFDRFFWKDPPTSSKDRLAYARAVLARFATKAYRRPVDDRTVGKLVAIAESVWHTPGKKFEDGIAEAMIPLLASPRFLFRVEQTESANSHDKYPLLDEYALASRLSYFLWSTMPDEELSNLAARHELRNNLEQQVKRMVDDHRSQALVDNFVGQWLQVRDLEGININERVVLARDRGEEKQLEQRFRRFRELQAISKEKRTPEEQAELQRMFDERRKRKNVPMVELDEGLRRAMRQETDMCFGYIMRENRSVLELIDSDYTFLNEKLAKHYGITNITGNEMRRVTLPADSPRGGVLTDGSILIVTSNPTRTSPVKRGLFILDNVLGIPPPPPPPNIPPLEDSEKGFTDHQPTLRETLEIHRGKPLCSSCHNRMDPLGLALENFNALGMWRESERGVPIDAGGKLITGETFNDIRDVKKALVSRHRLDFYRCLSEKLMIYALGRGLEYYDVGTVDNIVEALDKDGGRFSTLLNGVIHSAPFQRTRNPSANLASNRTSAPVMIK